jgi:hypothetical protein
MCVSFADVEPGTRVVTPAELLNMRLGATALVGECATIVTQLGQVPALRDAIQQRDALQAELEAAEKASSNFVLVGTLGEQLEAQQLQVTQQPLSEERYHTLRDSHASLVQKLIVTCRGLAEVKAYTQVKALGAKLQQLKALDLSTLPRRVEEGEDDGANDPVHVDPEDDQDDGVNDPVYVPPAGAVPPVSADCSDEEWANDPVYVPSVVPVEEG